ncbi:hypothetical protein [Rathayibacter toxicus]|uniref:hypothetical protein n=1 Tax=Rathayibacter toxicus TaxID=145458 RepID=UPI00048787BD|nr:hypothetical protein [Rathayibacter toxicus]QOD10920.1 hypothetical protein BSG36_02860 [Rathayibacter toxicus]
MAVISNNSRPQVSRNGRARPVGLLVLIAVLALQTAAVAILTGWLAIELVSMRAGTVGGGIAIVVLAGIALIWAAVTTCGAVRCRRWMRGSALTMQVVQLAVALGAFQGQYAMPEVGWLLLVPALLALVMMFLPSVNAATQGPSGSS